MFLIECSGLIFRSFHGLPPIAREADNHPVGAIDGCCNTFWRLARRHPAHAAVVFDKGRCKKRTGIDPGYKAQRPAPPDALVRQIPLIRQAAQHFGLAIVEMDNVEADDLIATYARIGVEAGIEVTIVCNDKDMYQLIRPGVRLFDPMKSCWIDAEYVLRRFGVHPEQMVDFQALVGDPTDNIHGVTGVGKVRASQLLENFGDLEGVLCAGAQGLIKGSVGIAINRDAEKARLAKQLVTLDASVPVTMDIAEFAYNGFDSRAVLEFLDEWDLPTLRNQVVTGLMEAAA